MAISKSAVTLQASATNSASGTTTGSTVDLTAAYGLVGVARITNGGTPPTTGCSFKIEYSNDDSTWRTWLSITAGIVASTSYDYPFNLPASVMYCRSKFTGNDQDVTVECLGSKTTGV